MDILLTDDDESVRKAVGAFLSARGHRIRTASGGEEALRLMEDDPPDLVISDIQMPGMDGIAFLKAVRERFSDLPVVLMTGHATAETAIAALRSRAYDYLKKPIQLEELIACVEAANYPNPFNPSTTIRYALPEASKVSLVVYNLLGQQVRTLVSGSQSAGYHSVVWDGRDAAGRMAATGVYIYRLQAGGFVQVRKMLFAK
jgi:DNA-binding NtrC family response regulator